MALCLVNHKDKFTFTFIALIYVKLDSDYIKFRKNEKLAHGVT
jgi:hypothetical protein